MNIWAWIACSALGMLMMALFVSAALELLRNPEQLPEYLLKMKEYEPLIWTERPATQLCTALSYAGHYTISCRPGEFTLSFRPPGKHSHLGIYKTLDEAQQAAEKDHRKNYES